LVKIDEDNYVIELAVAGFTRDSLDIEQHKNVLKVQGKKLDDESSEGNGYIHKGISSRSFTKNWTLAEHIEVVSVTLDHGILSIVLRRNVPEQDQPKTFTIK
jgi:molecular chaperone IbpA